MAMNSALNRLQTVFGFFTTVAFCVASLAALTTILYPAHDVSSSVVLADVKVSRGRPHYYSLKREEYAVIRFDLEADFTPLFNWNTKQIFVYVFAQYPPKSPPPRSSPDEPPHLSEAIIWDTIISTPESEYSFANLKEYFFLKKRKSTSSKSRSSSESKSKSKSSKSNSKSKSKTTKHKSTTTEPVEGRDSFAVLSLKNQKPKYQITDISGKVAERENVTLVVGWNVQPWVGSLWWSQGSGAAIPKTGGKVGRSDAFNFPTLKSTSDGTESKKGSKA